MHFQSSPIQKHTQHTAPLAHRQTAGWAVSQSVQVGTALCVSVASLVSVASKSLNINDLYVGGGGVKCLFAAICVANHP
jgi:hypothetical protein